MNKTDLKAKASALLAKAGYSGGKSSSDTTRDAKPREGIENFAERARGGRTGHGKTQVNVIVAGGGAGASGAPQPPMMPKPPMMPPPGMGGPPGMPPGGPPGIPPRPPGLARGGKVPMTAGAAGAQGRLDKVSAYGKRG